MISFQFLIKYRSKLIFLYNANPIRMIISLAFIVFPVKGLKVMEVIFSSLGNRQNMINFPTELAILAKGRFNHQGAAIILPEFIWIRSNYGVSFSPNSPIMVVLNRWPNLFVFLSRSMLNSPFFLVQDFSPFGYYVPFLYLGSGSISILI